MLNNSSKKVILNKILALKVNKIHFKFNFSNIYINHDLLKHTPTSTTSTIFTIYESQMCLINGLNHGFNLDCSIALASWSLYDGLDYIMYKIYLKYTKVDINWE